MDADSWNRPSGTSRRHLNALQSRFETFVGFEDAEIGEDDSRTEFPCPYCGEEFDMAGLCHHITDEHAIEAKSGVCPICEAKVGMDILDYVCHITMMHGSILKMHRRRKFHRGASMPHSSLSFLKRELRDGQFQSLFGSSSFALPSLNAAPDPLLSSFMYNSPGGSSIKEPQPQTADPKSMETKKVVNKAVEREEGLLTENEQKERARRASFVQGLMLSAVFGDDS